MHGYIIRYIRELSEKHVEKVRYYVLSYNVCRIILFILYYVLAYNACCVVYRPPDSQITCIREELKPMCIEALLLGKQVVIMGD